MSIKVSTFGCLGSVSAGDVVEGVDDGPLVGV